MPGRIRPRRGWRRACSRRSCCLGCLVTTALVAHPTFDLRLPAFGRPGWGDLPASLVIVSAGAALGMCAVRAFPYVHGAFGRLGHRCLRCRPADSSWAC